MKNNYSFSEVLRLMKKYWFIIAGVVIICVGVAVIKAMNPIDPTYEATAQAVVSRNDRVDNNGNTVVEMDPGRFWNTVPLLLKSQTFLENVKNKTSYPKDIKKLSEFIDVSNDNNSQIITVKVKYKDSLMAENIANEMINTLKETGQNYTEVKDVEFITKATSSNVLKINNSRPKATIFIGAILGVILGGFSAVMFGYSKNKYKN